MRHTVKHAARYAALFPLIFLGACTSVPKGPSVLVLPGGAKTFDQFRFDDFECRQFAETQTGGTSAGDAASDSGARSAVVGTLLGAIAGAAIDGGHGARVGAGAGLLTGGLAGSGAAHASAYGTQRRYDIGYQQCMYAKGNRIPVAGRFMTESMESGRRPLPPPPNTPPPR